MTHTSQNSTESPQFAPASSTPMVLACLAMIAAAYFGFMRPAQQHMLSLERQCNKLVVAVKKLQSKDDTARQGLRLINLLDAQSEKLASAERVVARFTSLRERMVQEADEMIEATAALQQMEDVRSDIDRYGETLAIAATTLSDMAEVSASITATSEIAREANGSLALLGDQQSGLEGSIAQLSEQLSALEVQLALQSEMLPQAEQALTQIDRLCEKLAEETKSISTARQQLSQLVGLKQEVLEQSTNVPDAEAALDQIWDLKEGLLQAKNTLDKAQQLTIDMMLLEPVLDRVAKTLQPSVEATRLSLRAEAKAPKTRQTASASNAASPWTSAMSVFVALLGNAE